MGLRPRISPGADSYAVRSNINPDPYNFKLMSWIEHGEYLVVRVKYPDCTNYEGEKILLFENMTIDEFAKLRCVDPHFTGNSKLIGRFRPDRAGMRLALFAMDMG